MPSIATISDARSTPCPSDEAAREERCAEIFEIQSRGLVQRLEHTRCKCAVIGISGGLDSTLALLVTVHAFDILGLDRKGIIGVTMPGFGTTGRTYANALNMMRALGVSIEEVSIKAACEQHFRDIGLPANDRSVTFENGARAHADTYGYCQHARRHGRRYGRYERAGAGLGDL